jgi:hypothetical protein
MKVAPKVTAVQFPAAPKKAKRAAAERRQALSTVS